MWIIFIIATSIAGWREEIIVVRLVISIRDIPAPVMGLDQTKIDGSIRGNTILNIVVILYYIRGFFGRGGVNDICMLEFESNVFYIWSGEFF